jgi:hypothetical protein
MYLYYDLILSRDVTSWLKIVSSITFDPILRTLLSSRRRRTSQKVQSDTSTMAEIVGVIASAWTLGTVVPQLAQLIVELKNCWTGKVSEEMKQTLLEIDVRARLLVDVKDAFDQHPDIVSDLAAIQCLTMCRAASEELETIVAEYRKDVGLPRGVRRARKVIRTVTQKPKVEKYLTRLRTLSQLLEVALQCYTMQVNFPMAEWCC